MCGMKMVISHLMSLILCFSTVSESNSVIGVTCKTSGRFRNLVLSRADKTARQKDKVHTKKVQRTQETLD